MAGPPAAGGRLLQPRVLPVYRVEAGFRPDAFLADPLALAGFFAALPVAADFAGFFAAFVAVPFAADRALFPAAGSAASPRRAGVCWPAVFPVAPALPERGSNSKPTLPWASRTR